MLRLLSSHCNQGFNLYSHVADFKTLKAASNRKTILVEVAGVTLYYFDIYISLVFNLLSLTFAECIRAVRDRKNQFHYFINDHVNRRTHTTSKKKDHRVEPSTLQTRTPKSHQGH